MLKMLLFFNLFFVGCHSFAQLSVKPPDLDPVYNNEVSDDDLFLLFKTSEGILKKFTVVEADLRYTPTADFDALELRVLNAESSITGLTNSVVTSLTGDVTGTGPGATTTTISTGAVNNSKMASMPAFTIKGNDNGSPSAPKDLTVPEANALLGSMSNPMTTAGDMVYADTGGTPLRIPPAASSGQILGFDVSGPAPVWRYPEQTRIVSGDDTTDEADNTLVIHDGVAVNVTLTLHDPSTVSGQKIRIVKLNSTNTLTISGYNIVGQVGTYSSGITLTQSGEVVELQSFGSSTWAVVGYSNNWSAWATSGAVNMGSSGNFANVTSLSVPAGYYDCKFGQGTVRNGATLSGNIDAGLTSVSGTASPGATPGVNIFATAGNNSATTQASIAGYRPFNDVTPFTVYLNSRVSYTVATPTNTGSIFCKRTGF